MLHLLIHTSKDSEFYYLLNDKEYVIGRKNTDIVISDDQSISRRHAVIKVQKNALVLIDCGSKYGTLHNNTKIVANKEVPLKDKDEIKFGVFQSTYRIKTMKIVTTASGLTNDQKVTLKKTISSLGGVFLNNWDDTCMTVTAQEIMLTIKVLHAVIEDRPIVTLQYWDQCLSNVNDKKPLPNPEDFKPPVAETLINRVSLTSNPGRRILFKDKIFVFPNEKIKNKMSELIKKTGGSCISWERQPVSLIQATRSKNYIFIHCDEVTEIPSSLKDIYNHLTKLGERTIPIQEIAMAIVLCSCEKDCNPKFNRIHNVFMEHPVDSASENFALAPETPSESSGSLDVTISKREMIIPGSLDAELQFQGPSTSSAKVCPSHFRDPSNTQSLFRNPFVFASTKRGEQSIASTPSKKLRVEMTETSTLQLKKRKTDANESDTPPPKKSAREDNPFAIFKNKVQVKQQANDNPFAAIRSNTINENKVVKKVTNTNVRNDDSNPIQEKSVNVTPSNSVSNIYTPSNASISNISWMVKNNHQPDSVVKDEVDPELDEDFKNVTIIEIIPNTTITELLSRHASQSRDDSSSSSTSNKINFKKFKKSMPRHRQTTIISLVEQVSSQSAKDEVPSGSDEEEEEEEEEEEVVVVAPKRPAVANRSATKRFNF